MRFLLTASQADQVLLRGYWRMRNLVILAKMTLPRFLLKQDCTRLEMEAQDQGENLCRGGWSGKDSGRPWRKRGFRRSQEEEEMRNSK